MSIQEKKIQADAEAQKAAIQAQVDQLKQSASQSIAQMQAALTPDAINPLITQLATVNTTGLSVSQAEEMLSRLMQKILYGG